MTGTDCSLFTHKSVPVIFESPCIKGLYDITRKLSTRKYQGVQPIKNKDGALLTNEDDQMKRWQEYFKEILNPTVIEIIPTTSSPTDRCADEAAKEEKEKEWKDHQIKMKLKKLSKTKNGKAPGLDNVPSELLKEDIVLTANILCTLFEKIWKQEKIPEEWRKSFLFKLPKKGSVLNCSNWR
jgi:hypothetical protein